MYIVYGNNISPARPTLFWRGRGYPSADRRSSTLIGLERPARGDTR
jgi:hypothetical protein